MPRTQRRPRVRSLLRSRLFTITLLVIAGAVSLSLGREIARRVSVKQELERLTRDIERAQASTTDLERLIATLKSSTYQEGAARLRRNLQKPGETVLVIPDLQRSNMNTQERAPAADEPVSRSNTGRWWKFLFTPKPS